MTRLVVWGATNKQVADLLHVSPKAVEGHLFRIYRKLGVRSRSELRTRLPPSGRAAPEILSREEFELSRSAD